MSAGRALPLLLVLASSCAPGVPSNESAGREESQAPIVSPLGVFAKCAPCHTAGEGEPNGIGPNLYGAYGSPAASKPDFRYSPAMRESGLVWNDATLDRYLENPRAVVPGTRMTFSGLKDEAQRKSAIAFLKQSAPARR